MRCACFCKLELKYKFQILFGTYVMKELCQRFSFSFSLVYIF